MPSVKSMGPDAQVELMALCLDCHIKHHILAAPGTRLLAELSDWDRKHTGHRIEFRSPKRIIPRDIDDSHFEEMGRGPWWLEAERFKENANIKLFYAASAAITITLASLASDANLLAGRSSTVVDNTSNLYLDYQLSGFITTGTSPTAAKEIDLYAYANLDDTPTYPDTQTGSDANVTATTANILQQALALVQKFSTSATSNEKNYAVQVAVSTLFGNITPPRWGIFVVHNTGVNLNATAGNHAFTQIGLYATSI